jgi:predicted RNA-binding protein with PUA-like domain
MPNHWLLKTEPSTYSFADLQRDRKTTWDGVSNPVALKHLAAMKQGDEAFIYHTGKEKAIIGIARVTKSAYPDPKLSDPKQVVVDLEPVAKLANPVALKSVKADRRFMDFALVRLSRLSVMPVNDAQWKALLAMAAT